MGGRTISESARIGSALEHITTLWRDFPDSVFKFPDDNTLAFYAAQDPINGDNALAFLQNDGRDVYGLIDVRNKNSGNNQVAGLDFSARYTHDTGFGTLFGSLAANYEFYNRDSLDSTSPYRQSSTGYDGHERYTATATIGATVGEHFLAQATLNHSPGTKLTQPLGTATPETIDDQDSIDDFDVVNLYFQYDMLGAGLSEDLTFSLGINNVADAEPPQYKGTFSGNFQQVGYAGSTLGRVVLFGVSKRF